MQRRNTVWCVTCSSMLRIVGEKIVENVNAVWSKALVVIHTSTMGTRHSFELDHFGWAVYFASNTVVY